MAKSLGEQYIEAEFYLDAAREYINSQVSGVIGQVDMNALKPFLSVNRGISDWISQELINSNFFQPPTDSWGEYRSSTKAEFYNPSIQKPNDRVWYIVDTLYVTPEVILSGWFGTGIDVDLDSAEIVSNNNYVPSAKAHRIIIQNDSRVADALDDLTTSVVKPMADSVKTLQESYDFLFNDMFGDYQGFISYLNNNTTEQIFNTRTLIQDLDTSVNKQIDKVVKNIQEQLDLVDVNLINQLDSDLSDVESDIRTLEQLAINDFNTLMASISQSYLNATGYTDREFSRLKNRIINNEREAKKYIESSIDTLELSLLNELDTEITDTLKYVDDEVKNILISRKNELIPINNRISNLETTTTTNINNIHNRISTTENTLTTKIDKGLTDETSNRKTAITEVKKLLSDLETTVSKAFREPIFVLNYIAKYSNIKQSRINKVLRKIIADLLE